MANYVERIHVLCKLDVLLTYSACVMCSECDLNSVVYIEPLLN